MRVLVTGGAGFIGSNLVRRLVASSHTDAVVVLDDFSTGCPENLADVAGIDLREGSILNERDLRAAIHGCEAVVHLAARPSVPRSIADPHASHEVNATGTLRVLEASRHHQNPYVVVASSSSVYGSTTVLPKHEDLATRPLSPYAVSKLAGENYALAYQACFGVRALVLRFFNVFGPRQRADSAYAAVIPAFVRAALEGRRLPVNGDGGQTRDFTYVDTVSETIARAVEQRISSNEPVNLAFGSRTTLLELIEILSSLLCRPLKIEHLPMRPGDVRDSQAENTRLLKLFGSIEPVALEVGLRATIEWMRGEKTFAGVAAQSSPDE